MDVNYRKSAAKGLRKLSKAEALRLMAQIDAIAAGASSGLDIKQLNGRPGFRLRMGRWRAIYKVSDTRLTVLPIGPRGDVYK